MWETIAVILLRLSVKAYPILEQWIEERLKAPPPVGADPMLHEAVKELLVKKGASAQAEEKLKAGQSAKVEELLKKRLVEISKNDITTNGTGSDNGEKH